MTIIWVLLYAWLFFYLVPGIIYEKIRDNLRLSIKVSYCSEDLVGSLEIQSHLNLIRDGWFKPGSWSL